MFLLSLERFNMIETKHALADRNLLKATMVI